MSDRVTNFAAGPSALPVKVLETAQAEMLNFQGTGMGLMELSHRSKAFDAVITGAEAKLRSLMKIPDNYKVIFMQGGGTTQFSCVALNLLGPPSADGAPPTADYIVTGTWSEKAATEAEKYGKINRVFQPLPKYTTIPAPSTWTLNPKASYVYYCANETVNGVEFSYVPETGDVPLVADMSSNILTRAIDVSKFGLIYAGAQKNIGCTGVTIVIVRDDLLGKAQPICPLMFDYKIMAGKGSMYNTPPTWSIYIASLVFSYMEECGGLTEYEKRSAAKSAALYSEVDASDGFYTAPVEPAARSRVNVPFQIRGGAKELEAKFMEEAGAAGMVQLAGHRSVGGLRASLYNALAVADAEKLKTFMADFKARTLAAEAN